MTAAEISKRKLIAEIVADSQEQLLDTIRWLVPTMEDAEDILQDVFYRLWANIDEIRSLENTAAWLYRVARNRVTDWYRNRSTSPRVQAQQPGGEDHYLLEDLLPASTDNPESRQERLEMGLAIDEALSSLPPNQRDVFVRHEIEGHSFRDIVAQTGIPMNTLLSRKHYAVLELRDQLKNFKNQT